jgi:hypothetical protein
MLFGAGIIVAVIATLANGYNALEAIFAPKLFLLEYAADLVRPNH